MLRPTIRSVLFSSILIGSGCSNDNEGSSATDRERTSHADEVPDVTDPEIAGKTARGGGVVVSSNSGAAGSASHKSTGGSTSRWGTGGSVFSVIVGGETSTTRPRNPIAGASAATEPTTAVNPLAIPILRIDVANGAAVTSKEQAVRCTIALDGQGHFANYAGPASIRGRGNSTWLWYEKKPYRIELDQKSEILGLKEEKDWVLLANYRDPTFLMNAFAFELADWMGIVFSNHSRFVEVVLNGDYVGLYQLTEQVEQGTNRVAVSDSGGLLLSLDEDDGPAAVPDAGNNFTSLTYELPVCVKYPKNQTEAQLSVIRADFAKLEQAVEAASYEELEPLLDIASFIDFLIIQELTYNVELVTPRSMYLHKNAGEPYMMGPVWDFDGGFDFDWTSMKTSHDYFAEQDLLLGADPARAGSVPAFWVNMFKNPRFVAEFKSRWAAQKDALLPHCWGVMASYAARLSAALERNAQRWPIGKDPATELGRMKQWLELRVSELNQTIGNYPAN